jgi:nicotinamide phosphoribosyltransferase
MLREHYDADMAGYSIPAAEHSTITAWGREGEVDAYRNMLKQFPTGLVAVVSDSWDIDNACTKIWGEELKDQVLGRDGVLVIRPDSGDPEVVVPRLLNKLGKVFDCYHNSKGYLMLPDKIRMIQGDGITRHSLKGILDAIMAAGWSTDNLAFGSGGGLLQQCNRDTLKFAFKCSSATVDGKERDVYKEPATASWKNSKPGRLALVKGEKIGVHNEYITARKNSMYDWNWDLMRLVFHNGKIITRHTLEEIRERAAL